MVAETYSSFLSEIIRIIEQLLQSEVLRATTKAALDTLHEVLKSFTKLLNVATDIAATFALAFLAQLAQFVSLLQGYNVSNAMLIPAVIDNELCQLAQLCRETADCLGDPNRSHCAVAKLEEAKIAIVNIFEGLKKAVKQAKCHNKWTYVGVVAGGAGVGFSAGAVYGAISSFTRIPASRVNPSLLGAGVGAAIGLAAGVVPYVQNDIRIEREAETRLFVLKSNLNRLRSIAKQLRGYPSSVVNEDQKRDINKLIEELTAVETMISSYDDF